MILVALSALKTVSQVEYRVCLGIGVGPCKGGKHHLSKNLIHLSLVSLIPKRRGSVCEKNRLIRRTSHRKLGSGITQVNRTTLGGGLTV